MRFDVAVALADGRTACIIAGVARGNACSSCCKGHGESKLESDDAAGCYGQSGIPSMGEMKLRWVLLGAK